MSPIPDSHLHLLTDPIHGVLTTMTEDGQPQSSIVWVGFDGEHVLISTSLERYKARNMVKNPRVTLLVIDPADANHFLEVRGQVADFVEDKGNVFVDSQTQLYSGGRKRRYYGDVFPETQEALETRVTFRIEIIKMNTDAIFK